MDHAEALKHLRTLINVASQADDMDEVQTIIRHGRGREQRPAARAAAARKAGPCHVGRYPDPKAQVVPPQCWLTLQREALAGQRTCLYIRSIQAGEDYRFRSRSQ
jgi:hypothetical protein